MSVLIAGTQRLTAPMSDLPADPPPVWNATERSRALTRGVLSSLARDRSAYFAMPLANVLVMSVLTLSVIPLLDFHRKISRWQRMRSAQVGELIDWLTRYQPLNLAVWPPTPTSQRSDLAVFTTYSFVAFVLAIGIALDDGHHGSAGMPILSDIHAPQWWRMLLVCVGSAWHLRQDVAAAWRWRADMSFESLNSMLVADERRPLRSAASLRRRYAATVPAALVVLAQGFTSLPVVLVLPLYVWWLQNRYVDEMRQINLQLIERLLEWMDDTGLPVEYDVTALNPDEIAAMMR